MKKKAISLSLLALLAMLLLTSCSFFSGLFSNAETNQTPRTVEPKTVDTTTNVEQTVEPTSEPTTVTPTVVEETTTTVNTTVVTTPTLVVHTDEKLTYSKEVDSYYLSLYVGETYQLNLDMGGYEDDDHYFIYRSSSSVFDISDDGLITTKNTGLAGSSPLYIYLCKTGDKLIDYVRVSVAVSYKTYDVSLSFNKGDMGYYRDFQYKWFFNLNEGETFKIKPIIGGITDYKLKYEVYADSTEYLSVTEDGTVSIKKPSEYSQYIILTVYDKFDMRQKQFPIACNINGTLESESKEYANTEIQLPVQDGTVKLIESEEQGYAYEMTIPYNNVQYETPTPILSGMTDAYTINYVSKVSYLTFDKLEGKYFIKYDYDFTTFFEIEARLPNGDLITSIRVKLIVSKLGKGDFNVTSYGGEMYYDEDVIDIYENEFISLAPMYNIKTNVKNDDEFSYRVKEGNSNISFSETGLYINIHGLSNGNSKIEFLYSSKDSNNVSYNYLITITIRVHKRVLVDIYVKNPEAMRISGDKLAINSKVIAIYEGEYEIRINNNSNLAYVIDDTDDPKYKKVTFTYTDGEVAKNKEYLIDVTKTDENNKIEISYHYYEMLDDNVDVKSAPNSGDVRILAIPVWFTDSSDFFDLTKKDSANRNQKEQVREDLNTAIFGTGINENNYYSIKEYYEAESYGAVNISGTVSDWYEIGTSYKIYKYMGNGSTLLTETKTIATSAVEWYFSVSGESVSDYDGNNDGIIDAVMIFYGSVYVGNPEEEYDYLQAGRAYVQKTNTPGLHYNNFAFISAFEMYNFNPYDGVGEATKAQDDLSSYNGSLETNVLVHEFGHIFGLTDYYDDNNSNNRPAGGATMQDTNYGGHDPYSVMAIGWTNPYVFDSGNYEVGYTTTITITDFQDAGDLILLTPTWNDSVFDEYILIELFNPDTNSLNTGYPFYVNLTTPGIRIWHVNTEIYNYTYRYSNTMPSGSEENTTPDILHYIRNDIDAKYGIDNGFMDDSNLFKAGDSFTLAKYATQFVNGDKLDSNIELGWSVVVEAINVDLQGNVSATLTLTRI